MNARVLHADPLSVGLRFSDGAITVAVSMPPETAFRLAEEISTEVGTFVDACRSRDASPEVRSIIQDFIDGHTEIARNSYAIDGQFDDELWKDSDPGIFQLVCRARALLARSGGKS